MKFWIRIVTEDTWTCGTCGKILNMGDDAFILVDTSLSIAKYEWSNCLDCLRLKFPNVGLFVIV